MIKRKLYLILIVTIGTLLISCSNKQSDKMADIKTTAKQETSSNQETSAEETSADKTTIEQPTTEEPTTDGLTTDKVYLNPAIHGSISELTGTELFRDVITTATTTETEGILTLKLEYPVIAGDTDGYKSVNELIERCARSATDIYYDKENLESIEISCKYDVIYFTDKYISIKFNILYAPIAVAHPTSICYGVTIDIEQAKVINLTDMGVTIEQIEKRAQDGLYDVIYGGLMLQSAEENMEYIDDVLDAKTSDYEGIFYRDADKIYMIVDGIGHGGGDFSILEFED